MKHGKVIVALGLVLLLAAVSLLTGCNTWRGAGRDVERTGEMMQGK